MKAALTFTVILLLACGAMAQTYTFVSWLDEGDVQEHDVTLTQSTSADVAHTVSLSALIPTSAEEALGTSYVVVDDGIPTARFNFSEEAPFTDVGDTYTDIRFTNEDPQDYVAHHLSVDDDSYTILDLKFKTVVSE